MTKIPHSVESRHIRITGMQTSITVCSALSAVRPGLRGRETAVRVRAKPVAPGADGGACRREGGGSAHLGSVRPKSREGAKRKRVGTSHPFESVAQGASGSLYSCSVSCGGNVGMAPFCVQT